MIPWDIPCVHMCTPESPPIYPIPSLPCGTLGSHGMFQAYTRELCIPTCPSHPICTMWYTGIPSDVPCVHMCTSESCAFPPVHLYHMAHWDPMGCPTCTPATFRHFYLERKVNIIHKWRKQKYLLRAKTKATMHYKT